MTFGRLLKASGLFIAAVVVGALLVTGCSSPVPSTPRSPATSEVPTTPLDRWAALLQRTPFPYHTPLPPPTPTALDGTYTKVDPKTATPVPCRRCPDYAPEGGIWKLYLDRGIFRIYHPITGWRSMGSYTVSGDRIVFFNDPVCPDLVGTYTWKLEEGTLTFEVVEDRCSASILRAMNLTSLPWLSCQPPSTEAAITDHWPKPPGCD